MRKVDVHGHRPDVRARWLPLCPGILPDGSKSLGRSVIDRPGSDGMCGALKTWLPQVNWPEGRHEEEGTPGSWEGDEGQQG